MQTYMKVLAVLAIGTTAMAATPAMARVNVDLNIGIPGVYVEPAPVYVQPRPVYVHPQPVYVHPQPVYVQPRPYGYGPHWRHGHGRGHGHGHGHGRRDWDRDGVPNRYDHAPNNPYRY